MAKMFIGTIFILHACINVWNATGFKVNLAKDENSESIHEEEKLFNSINNAKTEKHLKKNPDIRKNTDDGLKLTTDNSIFNTTFPILRATNDIEHLCPEGFHYYRHYGNIPYCYYLTNKQQYPPICPYQNYLEHDSMRVIFEKFENQTMWVRAKRNRETGFGQFEWLYPSYRYKEIIKDYINPPDSIMERNCMIRKAGKIEKLVPAFCHEEHPMLCVYSYGQRTMEKYCSKRNHFTSCISTSLNLDNKCYCQAHVEGMEAPRTAFCQKLAEPMDPFQNHMLLNQLANKSPCWFGIQHDGDAEFHWTSSKNPLNYSYWKENVDTSKRYGALDYAKPKGWILKDDLALKCAICETEVPYQNVTLRLVHIPSQNKIELRITNVFDVHSYFLIQYVMVCYTDGNDDGIDTRILSVLSDLISITTENYTKTINIKFYYPSYYWCETFQRPNLTRVFSNKILVYKDTGKHGHEYALTITVLVQKGIDPYLKNLHVQASKLVNKTLHKETKLVNTVRPMRVLELSQTEEHMKLLLHMSIKRNLLSSQEEYKVILDVLQKLTERPKNDILSVVNFARSEVCLPNTTESGNISLHWPETKIGTTALPKELCLRADSTAVTRKCEGSFLFGAVWGDVQGDCYPKLDISERTLVLYDLLNSEESSSEISYKLCEVTMYKRNVLVIDVHFMAEILEKLAGFDDGNVTQIVNTLTNIMEFDEDVLKDAQKQLNSTDRMLYALDTISAKIELNNSSDYVEVISRKVLLQVSNLQKSNVTGLIVQNITSEKGYSTLVAKPLYNDVLIQDLLTEDLEVAILLPQEHVEEIHACMQNENAETRLTIGFFHDDKLFNEVVENDMQENSRVISVFIPGSICTFKNPILMIFKPLQNGTVFNCGHWNYGTNAKMESIHGNWKINSAPNISINESTYAICQFSHTTHFALLMYHENFTEELPEETVLALNIITAIGCGLSLLGIAGIFITAIAFKSWRSRTRNIIMLNFSASLAAQTILLFVSDNARENSLTCLISGASLHYTILSEFAWMLIVAILQYRKFVLVFQTPISYLILKCLIVGWCLPLIPVGVMFGVFPETYEQNTWGLCYPQGNYFYWGLAFPVGTIVLINLFVFIRILLNICHRKVEAYGSKDNDMKLQLLLAILLFFLLGMSWIFGLAAALFGWLLFSYLFCLTATLQGFVIFLFFVIMNEKSRRLWLNIKKICLCADIQKQVR